MQDNGITVISDPGVDDLVALALIDVLTPGVPKQLVSTYGNIRAEDTATNARAFVAAMGEDWTYRRGADMPSSGLEPKAWRDGSKGKHGVWGIQPPAVRTCLPATDIANSSLVFSLATMTETLAVLTSTKPVGLCVMAGDLSPQGLPELNARMDPAATKAVLENGRLDQFRLVDGDVCEAVYWDEATVRSIPENNAKCTWIKRLLIAGFDNGTYTAGEPFVLYDPLAVYLWYKPGAAIWTKRAISVDANGRTRYAESGRERLIAQTLKQPGAISREIYDLIFMRTSL